jgi:hypothetical protein
MSDFKQNLRNLTFIDSVNKTDANLLHIYVAYHSPVKFLACNMVIGPEMQSRWAYKGVYVLHDISS